MGEILGPILGDVNIGKVFRTCNGYVIHNIYELVTFLEGCSEYDFSYHVNTDHFKNDFAIWVREVIQDEILARNLDTETDKESYTHKIKSRLQELEKQRHKRLRMEDG